MSIIIIIIIITQFFTRHVSVGYDEIEGEYWVY